MRDGEGLVQVQVTDIGTDEAWVGQTDLRIHIRPIHIDESSAVVDALAEVDDVRLKDPVRTGIGDHHCCEVVLMLFGLLHEVLPVNITMLVAGNNDALIATLRG